MNFTTEELLEIEKQLSYPEGESGLKMAENMNESNIQMTISAIDSLHIADGNVLLEIGHGNCGHLDKIFDISKNIQYTGLEISSTMKNEAERRNRELIKEYDINFLLYDGIQLPFSNDSIDKIFTVNTLYFWKNPTHFLNEIYRVLRIGGQLVLTFAQKEFMKKLPFVKDKFCLYNNKDIINLTNTTNFQITEFIDKKDIVKSKSGDVVEREYTVVKMTKS
ncbi:class I SAM-dependent methyltransferase [Aquimarina sp. 2201CG1-2-11]|uniref:class I SAM-dependent methyltransferase n=1 Tax=Aquimarina discodermiae TaxID=3231043 RepID=UPI0034617FCE